LSAHIKMIANLQASNLPMPLSRQTSVDSISSQEPPGVSDLDRESLGRSPSNHPEEKRFLGKDGHVDLSVEELRAEVDKWKDEKATEQALFSKESFFSRFGKPLSITDVYDRTYLLYRCTDGMARVEVVTGDFHNGRVRPFAVGQMY
jgi:hypothetical protein